MEKDESAHRFVVEAKGKDKRGNGTAGANVTVSMADASGATDVEVVTDLSITGKPAQFGRGMIADVGGKIIEQFSACLSEKLAVPVTAAPTTEAPEVSTPAEPAEVEPLNLVHYAQRSVLTRIGPLAAAAVAILVIGALVRRLRSRD